MGDCTYGTAETLARLEDAGYEDVKAKLASATGRAGRFGKDDFTVDLETGEVTCPAGNTAAIRTAENGSGLVDFAAQCTGCPLRASCTTSAAGHTVTIHPREDLLRSHKAAQRDRLAGGLHRHPAQGEAQDRPLRAPLLGRTAGPGPRPGPHRDRRRHPRRGHQLVPSRHPRSQLLRRDVDRRPP